VPGEARDNQPALVRRLEQATSRMADVERLATNDNGQPDEDDSAIVAPYETIVRDEQ
jgi:hypothetical protein